MEIRNKFKKQTTRKTLKRHINFDIDQHRDNTRLLKIDQHGHANAQQLKNAYGLMTRDTTNRGGNNQIWHLIKEILYSQQKQESTTQETTNDLNIGKTPQEITAEKKLVIKK